MDQHSQSQNPNPDTLHTLLNESIHRFLTEYQAGVTDFSNFTLIFSRFLHNLPDPPLEIVWFYSALTFHSSKLTAQENTIKQVSVTKDLFQLLVSWSSSCNTVKKIAILAPVINELFSSVSGKKEPRGDIESLIEGVVCYISISCGGNLKESEELGDQIVCFPELVRVWMLQKIGEECKIGGNLSLFCPIASDRVRERMVDEGCEVGHLAGVVMCQAFLLRLCMMFGCGISGVELGKELRNSVVQMLRVFQNYNFLDALLRMLLEPILPLSSLLNYKDEVTLRDVLYDCVMTMDHFFPGPQKGIQSPGGCLKNLAVTFLFVADNAIRFVRENGDQAKVLSYLHAFSQSCLLSQLIKWVTNQLCEQSKTNMPNVCTPVSLTRWLLLVEDQGVRIFDSDISKNYATSIICRTECERAIKLDGTNLVENNFVFPGNEGKEEDKVDGDLQMVDSADTKFFAAPGLMKLTETNGIRKRKDGRNEEVGKSVKFFKCHLGDNVAREKKVWPLHGGDGFANGNELYNAISVENTEYMEQ